nr:hypothetical protein [Mycoplasmopsis bovis]
MPLVTVSCKFFGLNVSEIITGGPSHTTPPRKDPDHKDSFNENEQEIVPTKFTYNGKTYTINREDILDTKNAVYANLVLNNNAEGFKKLIPKCGRV